MGDVAGGVGENEVVDIGVWEGGIRILKETVEEEEDTEKNCSSKDFALGEEGGHGGDQRRWC